jgi:UDP-N-acetylglucosamine--N-acetylmuramyl-(pentapeptide) pyrophosphoryl-undecaprenol N-acetylglucosamine transferase
MTFKSIPASHDEPQKIGNVFLYIKNILQIIRAFFMLFYLLPDVIFSKGGKTTFPLLVASRIFGIPVVIHESNSIPSSSNLWASSFAQRIAVSYDLAAQHFPLSKTAHTGQPVRKEISFAIPDGGNEYLRLEPNVKTILILGGATGSVKINETILDILPEITKEFQIIHQVGKDHLAEMKGRASVVLHGTPYQYRYHPFSFLDDLALRMAAGTATLAISRAGATLFELASWGLPSIVAPLTVSEDISQKENAFTYARAGACVVIEEANLSPHILLSEIARLTENPELLAKMRENAKKFFQADASDKIANALLDIALSHEK